MCLASVCTRFIYFDRQIVPLLMHPRYELMEKLTWLPIFLVHACAAGYKNVGQHTDPSPYPLFPTLMFGSV